MDSRLGSRNAQTEPLYDFTASSTRDFPTLEVMRLAHVDVETEKGTGEVIVKDSIEIYPMILDEIPREAISEYKNHRGRLASYRSLSQYYGDKKIRGIIHSQGFTKTLRVLAYLLNQGQSKSNTYWDMVWHDTVPLMVYQYNELIHQTRSVIKLLKMDEADHPEADKIRLIIDELESHVKQMERHFEKWYERAFEPAKAARERYDELVEKGTEPREVPGRQLEQAYDDFVRAAEEVIKLPYVPTGRAHFHEFEGEDLPYGAVGLTQMALHDIPQDSIAYKFMFLMAWEGAKEDYEAKASAVQRFQTPFKYD